MFVFFPITSVLLLNHSAVIERKSCFDLKSWSSTSNQGLMSKKTRRAGWSICIRLQLHGYKGTLVCVLVCPPVFTLSRSMEGLYLRKGGSVSRKSTKSRMKAGKLLGEQVTFLCTWDVSVKELWHYTIQKMGLGRIRHVFISFDFRNLLAQSQFVLIPIQIVNFNTSSFKMMLLLIYLVLLF